MAHQLLAQDPFKDTFGNVSPPPGVVDFNKQAGGATTSVGILLFASNIIKLMTIVGGMWVLFNFVSAGFEYITSAGDSAANNRVRDKLTMSVLGLIIMVGAYTIIALLSVVLFGDPGYILNPKIVGPSQ